MKTVQLRLIVVLEKKFISDLIKMGTKLRLKLVYERT